MSNSSEKSDLLPEAIESHCAICNAALTGGAGYVVRIDIFADPAWSDSGLPDNGAKVQESLTELMGQIKSMTAEELQDGVHRRFEYHICQRCHPKLLANPLGLPRISRDGTN
jgi:hypothetical protein